jgi:outer membrane protein, multidrug efflux system
VSQTVRMSSSSQSSRLFALLLTLGSLSACALQQPAATQLPAYTPANKPWHNSASDVDPKASATAKLSSAWWQVLGAKEIDQLVATALDSSPTVARAVARVQEVRAGLDVAQAGQWPRLSTQASASRSDQGQGQGQAVSVAQTLFSQSLNLSWEVDLFGRVKHATAAANQRLQSSEADSQAAQLSLSAQVVDTIVAQRACESQLVDRREDLRSRTATLEIVSARHAVGMVAGSEKLRAQSSAADAATSLAVTQGQCQQLLNALEALTGVEISQLQSTLAKIDLQALLRQTPQLQPALPASVIASHPQVIAALRSADAAFEDIGSAKAQRLPSLNLSAVLGGQWIRAFGGTNNATQWSLGPSGSFAIFDGGAGKANEAATLARYKQAVANLESQVRGVKQDVENALTAVNSAIQRTQTSAGALTAARDLVEANELSYKAGRISLFELEDARRSLLNVQTARTSAERDRVQSWVALVKALGGKQSDQ